MYSGKPIIGIVGGIGSGKSFVASLLGEMGCGVIDSDKLAHQAYERQEVRQAVRDRWGEGIFLPDGRLDRKSLASLIFADPEGKKELEKLIHPLIDQQRKSLLEQGSKDAQVLAFVIDAPLLFEVGLEKECDAVIFVDAPLEVRRERVAKTRGWDAGELAKRENFQIPLDKKAQMSDYIVLNTASADQVRVQVREVLYRILNGMR